MDKKVKNVMTETFDMGSFVRSLNDYRVIIIGKNGSGKTVFARSLITKVQSGKKHKILIVDTKDEFGDKKYFVRLDLNHKTFIRKVVALKIAGDITDDPRILTEYAASIIWEFSPATLYVEEVEEFVDVNAHMSKQHLMLYKVNQQGRERKACLILVCQQAQKLHKTFFNQQSDVFVFALTAMELREVEKVLKQPQKTFKFDIPTKKELEEGIIKDLYSFYHLENLQNPTFYKPITFGRRGRKAKAKN